MAATSTRTSAVWPGVTALVMSTEPHGQEHVAAFLAVHKDNRVGGQRSKRRLMARPCQSAGMGTCRSYQALATRAPSKSSHCGPPPGATKEEEPDDDEPPRRDPPRACQFPAP